MTKLLLLSIFILPSLSYAREKTANSVTNDVEEAREFQEFQEFKRLKTAPSPAPKTQSFEYSDQEKAILAKGEMPEGSYIAGGIVGTVVGFGIGHAIQGRYSERGWIFTAGELASLALFYNYVSQCADGAARGSTSACDQRSGMGAFGFFAFAGFKLWEIIDLWAIPPSQNAEYRRLKSLSAHHPLSFFATPSARSGDGLASVELGFHYEF